MFDCFQALTEEGLVKKWDGVLIDATSACKYWDFSINSFFLNRLPNIAPPFPRIFTELPKYRGMGFAHGGVEIRCLDGIEAVRNFIDRVPALGDTNMFNASNAIRWGLVLSAYSYSTNNDRILPWGHSLVMANDKGAPIWAKFVSYKDDSEENDGWSTDPKHCADWPEGSLEDTAGVSRWAGLAISTLFGPSLFSISLMHCKNITVIDGGYDRPTRRRAQREGRELLQYKVLDINPMREVLRREGRADSDGLKRALHICRGHFATYTEDRPLFGRQAGTFWISDHVRGAADQGIIIKDYRVGEGAIR